MEKKVQVHSIEVRNKEGDVYKREYYFTSDDEIKEGDYYMTDAGVFKCSYADQERELNKFRKIWLQQISL